MWVVACHEPGEMPAVDISVSVTNLPGSVIRSGFFAVQSFVLHPEFNSCDLLTLECVEKLKSNLPVGHQFQFRDSFDPWAGESSFCRGNL